MRSEGDEMPEIVVVVPREQKFSRILCGLILDEAERPFSVLILMKKFGKIRA